MDIEKVKELRRQTGISLGHCRQALEEAGGDLAKAKEILKEKGMETLAKKAQRSVGSGLIESYIHASGKVGVLLELRCETDFVAANKEFKEMAHEICLQIAAVSPETIEELLETPWIKDESRKIGDLLTEKVAKLGENILVERFVRYEI